MNRQLEHVNIRVKDIEKAVRFLTTALPNFAIRGGRRRDNNDWEWVHVGTDSTYLCLNEAHGEAQPVGGPGLNHIGFVVEDAGSVRSRLEDAGYKQGFVPDPHPHRTRLYYIDGNGTEWEFVEYHADDPGERNDYTE